MTPAEQEPNLKEMELDLENLVWTDQTSIIMTYSKSSGTRANDFHFVSFSRHNQIFSLFPVFLFKILHLPRTQTQTKNTIQ